MWDDRKSLSLSRLCIILFMCVLIVTDIFSPWIVRRFVDFSRAGISGTEPYFLITIYVGTLPAAYLLYSMLRLLDRIKSDQVFIMENVERIRGISWSCFAGAIISLISTFYYFPWIFVAVAAAFMGLIVRVVKNVVAKAVELQDEMDYTV